MFETPKHWLSAVTLRWARALCVSTDPVLNPGGLGHLLRSKISWVVGRPAETRGWDPDIPISLYCSHRSCSLGGELAHYRTAGLLWGINQHKNVPLNAFTLRCYYVPGQLRPSASSWQRHKLDATTRSARHTDTPWPWTPGARCWVTAGGRSQVWCLWRWTWGKLEAQGGTCRSSSTAETMPSTAACLKPERNVGGV